MRHITLHQALLTGESEPVLKEPALEVEENAEIQSRSNMVFSGTTSERCGRGVTSVTGVTHVTCR